ncbi:MAG: MerR family transcriptional regulator [Thermoanaerobaculia bacterium]
MITEGLVPSLPLPPSPPSPRRLHIGEFAASAGVSVDTVRHYERSGLLPRAERSPGGYREFPPEALEQLRTVRAALAVGFSIQELARVLGERRRGGAPCRTVRAVVAEKLAEVERQQDELESVRRTLIALLTDWDARLAELPAGRRAHLLENLPTHEAAADARAVAVPSPTRRLRRRTSKSKERS